MSVISLTTDNGFWLVLQNALWSQKTRRNAVICIPTWESTREKHIENAQMVEPARKDCWPSKETSPVHWLGPPLDTQLVICQNVAKCYIWIFHISAYLCFTSSHGFDIVMTTTVLKREDVVLASMDFIVGFPFSLRKNQCKGHIS